VLLLGALGALAGWWILRRSLPQLEGSISLPHVQQAVTVERDDYGVPTITAQSMEDLLVAQGFVMAQDRLWQMDLIRRSAAGELAEIFGSVALEADKENRTLGLRQAAEASVAALPAEMRASAEAYARGVNAYLEQQRGRLPWEFTVLRYAPRPWTPADSSLVHAYMYRVLAETWEWELSRARVTELVGAERARELFPVDSPHDRVLVGGEPAPAARPAAALRKAAQAFPARSASAAVYLSAARALADDAPEFEWRPGSNNWVVSGAHTYSGKPLLANDTHLQNDVPAIWYMAHLKAPGYNAKGFCLPGGPLVVIGHNERIAWGFTNNGADVQDLYVETFHPANPRQYQVNGQWVDAQVRTEVIKVKGQPDVLHEVVVTRHGPVVHRDAKGAYALKWTALQPGGLGMAHAEVSRAQNWPEFLAASRRISGPAQNAVYADVDGNIGFVVAAHIPVRKKGNGSVPVPGDTDDYEWTGYIPFDALPQVLNPASGMMATANARVVGPGYKHFITDRWYEPERTKRIYELLRGHAGKFEPEDFLRIQRDIVSGPHRILAGYWHAALRKAAPQDPRTRAIGEELKGWDGAAMKSSLLVAPVEYLRREMMRDLLRQYLKDGPVRYQWSRGFTFLEKVLRERPAHWLPAPHTDYDQWIVACADRAVRQLEADTRRAGARDPASPQSWIWGHYLPIQMLHPFGRGGFLSRHLSVSGFGQNGTGFTVKQTGRTFGPAMRFVADLSNWDASLMNITMGQSGQYLSRHYRDQFDIWFEGAGLPSAFSDAARAPRRRHTLKLVPTVP
jgi:penicillin amidase